jgi:DNA-binding response OmpR family regulator
MVAADPSLADAVASELATAGLAMGHARDGAEALHQLAVQRPAAVVLDLDVSLVCPVSLVCLATACSRSSPRAPRPAVCRW